MVFLETYSSIDGLLASFSVNLSNNKPFTEIEFGGGVLGVDAVEFSDGAFNSTVVKRLSRILPPS